MKKAGCLGSLGCLACLLLASTALAAPAWLPVTNLSAPGRDATSSAVAMGEGGETVAVWQRQSEAEEVNLAIQASTRSAGGEFAAPVVLSPAATEPAVAMTPSGEAVAIWRHFEVNNKGSYAIQASFRPPGGTFSAPLDVAVLPNKALPQDLHVAVNAAGATAVVWTQQEPESGLSPNPTLVAAAVRPPGGSFSAPSTVSPLPLVAGRSAQSPRVAIDAAGDVAVVWEYENGTNEVIQASTASPGAGFSPPVTLSASGQNAVNPAIAMTPKGEATVLWSRTNGTSFVVEAAARPPGGSFSAPLELSNPSQSAFEGALAVDPGGTATVAWTRTNGANFIIEASKGSVGGGFSAPAPLSESGQTAFNPAVAVSPSGAATVTWKRSNGANQIVQAAIAQPGGSFSTPQDLSAAGQDAAFPKVAMDAAGDATAIWWRSDGSNQIVQAVGYDADAPQLRRLSLPSSGTVGVPVSFSASPFDVWPIASTTFAFGDGSTASGTSVSHVYGVLGTYRVSVVAKDAAGTQVTGGGTIAILPPNWFGIHRISRFRRTGKGGVRVKVPAPGVLVLSGADVKTAIKRPRKARTVRLPIRPRGGAFLKLKKRGVARVALAIAFTPDGGATSVKHKGVTLVQRRRRG